MTETRKVKVLLKLVGWLESGEDWELIPLPQILRQYIWSLGLFRVATAAQLTNINVINRFAPANCKINVNENRELMNMVSIYGYRLYFIWQ